jgi:uncharacterized protein
MKETRNNSKNKFKIKRSKSGLGLFALKCFKRGKFIVEYTGRLISNQEADKKNSKYLFALDSKWTIDGSGRENIGRYINHSCRPNAEAVICGRKIKIYARKKITPGEELCYDYGREYFDEYIKPLGCRCGFCSCNKHS